MGTSLKSIVNTSVGIGSGPSSLHACDDRQIVAVWRYCCVAAPPPLPIHPPVPIIIYTDITIVVVPTCSIYTSSSGSQTACIPYSTDVKHSAALLPPPTDCIDVMLHVYGPLDMYKTMVEVLPASKNLPDGRYPHAPT